MKIIKKHGIYLLVCVFLLGFAVYRCFESISNVPLERWDEQTNAIVVRELIDQGTFPYLTYDGKPFFEKPPLWYFLTSIPVGLFGLTPFTLRIVSSFSGLFIICLVLKIGHDWYGNLASFVAAALLLTTNQLFTFNAGGFFSSHTLWSADPDSLQILFIILSLYCFVQSLGKKSGWIYAGFLFSALSVLTKGPFGLLPPIIYFIYMFICGQFKAGGLKLFARGSGLFLLILIPWYLLMLRAYGNSFYAEHFGYHVIYRITVPLDGHKEPWWFYLQILGNKYLFLGFEALVMSIVYLFWSKKAFLVSKTITPILMVMSVYIIATAVATKLAWYILPIYPFAALVIGNAMQEIYNQLPSLRRV